MERGPSRAGSLWRGLWMGRATTGTPPTPDAGSACEAAQLLGWDGASCGRSRSLDGVYFSLGILARLSPFGSRLRRSSSVRSASRRRRSALRSRVGPSCCALAGSLRIAPGAPPAWTPDVPPPLKCNETHSGPLYGPLHRLLALRFSRRSLPSDTARPRGGRLSWVVRARGVARRVAFVRRARRSTRVGS